MWGGSEERWCGEVVWGGSEERWCGEVVRGGGEGRWCGDRSGLSLLSLSRDMVCVTYCM